MSDQTNAIILSGDEDDRDIDAEVQQFINVTGRNEEKALQYIYRYKSIEDAITNFFHYKEFGAIGDVSVPDIFNTARETVTSSLSELLAKKKREQEEENNHNETNINLTKRTISKTTTTSDTAKRKPPPKKAAINNGQVSGVWIAVGRTANNTNKKNPAYTTRQLFL